MKRVTIKIVVPKKGNPSKATVGYGIFKRPNATQVYNYVERRLLALQPPTKIYLLVDYNAMHPLDPEGWINEGEYETNKEALYALATFLEDYTSPEFQSSKYQKYG